MVSSSAATVADYLAELDPERRTQIETVRKVVNAALPAGYVEVMSYGMIGWVIPLANYLLKLMEEPPSYLMLVLLTTLEI